MNGDPVTVISITAALLAGLAGSAHCLGMCGGLASALGMRHRSAATSAMHGAAHASLYQFGRIGGYTLAGALCGAAGSTLHTLLDLARIGMTLRIASGVLLLLIALRLLVRWNGLGTLERWGAKFWRHVQPLARHVALRSDVQGSLLLGFLWGWLPCGLVYSMLMFAAVSADPMRGALIMAGFGLGTLPAMFASSWFAPQLTRLLNVRWSRYASGALLLMFGTWMIAAPLLGHGHGGHMH